MWGMVAVGSVITVSTRGRAEKFERMAKSRIERDGVTQLAAETSNRRQLRLLREVRDLLVTDPALEVFGPGDHGDGMSYVWVHPAGTRPAGVWGQPNGMTEDDPEDIEVVFLDDLG
jgi:hypothetical protein